MIFSSKTHLLPKSHQGNKAHWTQRKDEIADKIFSKMDVLCKWEQVTILLRTLPNVRNKTVFFFFGLFVFSENENQFFL